VATISIRGVTKRFGALIAVDDLSLDVADGEFVTLLGPSGCGKTTTLRMLAGFVRPDVGEIAVDDRVISSPRQVVPPEKRGMGMVFQNYAVWPHMTVFENVAFGLEVRGVREAEKRDRVSRVLDMVGLGRLATRLPSQLSGGQQQRVALARALVVEPSILLLDEPLSNLDAKLRERMRGELKELQKRTGITFVYVTHDQTEALALSDRVAVMHGGQLQQYATPRDIYQRPSNQLVADLLGQVTLWSGVSMQATARGSLATIQLETGTLVRAIVNQPVSAQQSLTVAVRPEDVTVGRQVAAPPLNSFNMRVADLTFLGSVVQLRLESGDFRLRAQVTPHVDFAEGESVFATVDPERVVVLV
jgi:iron(III) transport system ATP-binding protein